MYKLQEVSLRLCYHDGGMKVALISQKRLALSIFILLFVQTDILMTLFPIVVKVLYNGDDNKLRPLFDGDRFLGDEALRSATILPGTFQTRWNVLILIPVHRLVPMAITSCGRLSIVMGLKQPSWV